MMAASGNHYPPPESISGPQSDKNARQDEIFRSLGQCRRVAGKNPMTVSTLRVINSPPVRGEFKRRP